MYKPHSAMAPVSPNAASVTPASYAQAVANLQNKAPLMRKYSAVWLDSEGREQWMERLAPATPDFEQAFSSVTHSTLIFSPSGPIQASDLMPGDLITGASGKTRQVVWIGSMTGVPTFDSPHLPPFRLVRISADAFGLDRPMGDLTLAPHAQLSLGHDLMPASDRVDGDAACEIMPQSSVRMYHVMLDRPDSILANGVPVASFVAQGSRYDQMGPNRKALFKSFFAETSFPRLEAQF